jgi:hypothetical protein
MENKLQYYPGRKEKILNSIEGKDHKEIQLVMAKITGNFKRGNEKDNKSEQ